MRDSDMWIQDWNLNNLELIQLIKDHTMDQALSEVEFYLDTSTDWKYDDLTDHLKTSFPSWETFHSLIGNFTDITIGKGKR